MKRCREMRARITAAIEGELAIEALFALERHCDACADCRRRYAASRALETALARIPDPPVERIDVEREVALVRAAIDRAIDPLNEREIARAGDRRGRSVWRALATAPILAAASTLAAASVLVLTVLAIRPLDQASEPDRPRSDDLAGARPGSNPSSRPPASPSGETYLDADADVAAHAAVDDAADATTDGVARAAADDIDPSRRTSERSAIDAAIEAAGEVAWIGPSGAGSAIDSASSVDASAVASEPAIDPSKAREVAAPPFAAAVEADALALATASELGATPAADPIDVERLARARARVREHLLAASSAALEGEDGSAARTLAGEFDARAFANEFDARASELARSGWPVLRLVEGALADPDPGVARSALRYLGLRGDRLALARIRAALLHPVLAHDAVRALHDAQDAGLAGLGAALAATPARADALDALVARGDVLAARTIEQAVAQAMRAPAELRNELAAAIAQELEALATIGVPALGSLIRLCAEGRFRDDVLGALERTRGAREALGAWLVAEESSARPARQDDLDGVASLDPELLMRAVVRLQPQAGVPWLLALCEERERRERALDALGALGTAEALRALADLRSAGRFALDPIDGAVRAACARRPELVLALVREGPESPESNGERIADTLFAALIGAPSAACVSALVALAGVPTLADLDRRTALLVAGELGAPSDADALVALFATLGPRQKELRAACLLAIDALAGTAAVERALAHAPANARSRVLALLAARGSHARPTTTLLRLAREIEPELTYPKP